ncbi:type II toxin-antitoxin system PemK/MazF family toxin [Chloroflexia bacterium SDU3-3]|nr:type II toxin-antitoxin system PemK/MazF family toxin [Chloroflexia bacterium SDU3-3]
MGMVAKRFDVFVVNLDPTVGSEIQKTRPCLIISPNELNDYIQTVIIAPMTSKSRSYPTRVTCTFEDRECHIILDQIRTVDKRRLLKHIGQIDTRTQQHVLDVLAQLFSK